MWTIENDSIIFYLNWILPNGHFIVFMILFFSSCFFFSWILFSTTSMVLTHRSHRTIKEPKKFIFILHSCMFVALLLLFKIVRCFEWSETNFLGVHRHLDDVLALSSATESYVHNRWCSVFYENKEKNT